MSPAVGIVGGTEAEVCRPWLRHILTHGEWTGLAVASVAEAWPLLAHWADTIQVHALFLDPEALTVVLVSTPVEAGSYPALSPILPGAAWYERMVHDLWGHTATGATDLRPWLDHGRWPQIRPMASRPEPRTMMEPPDLSGTDPADAMVLPLGPVWGRLEEAAHLRLVLDGSLIARAEAFLGFTHKGSLTLMRGKSPRAAARFAARLSGDATVAHALAFAQATEAALDVVAPARAATLRIVMLEIERIAVHLHTLAEVARLAAFPAVENRCGVLREHLLRAAETAFGHRLMMDCVVPGGVATDIAAPGAEAILRALGEIAGQLEELSRLHDGPALASRLRFLGRAEAEWVAALGVGGVVGRTAGRGFDVRAVFAPAYAPLAPQPVMRTEGDAAARQHGRLLEIAESLRLIGIALESLPDGPLTIALPQVSGEGIGCAESARGDVWHWLRLDHGQIAAAFTRDPGWALWPLAEHVLLRTPAEEAALVRASLALPASGMDL
ncbi:MAG TPA: NADH-quinone oxidoreductase subunit C [Rhodopila sp.]|nr:NADH-quinone oxidoreductase subunit C [Rhodopila sp.]